MKLIALIIIFLLLLTLATTIYSIYSYQHELKEIKEDFLSYAVYVNKTIESLNKSLANATNLIKQQKDRIDFIEYDIRRLYIKTSQKGLVNPSFEDLKKFVEEDDTDKFEWKEKVFTCVEFTNRFIMNFAKHGYFSCHAYVEFEDGGHAIVAVNTTDKGIVYIEPQSDRIIFSLNAGENYCEKVGWNCEWIIQKISSCFALKLI